MSRSLTSRLTAQSLFQTPRATASKSSFQITRSISQTNSNHDDKPRRAPSRPSTASLLENIYGPSETSKTRSSTNNAMANLSQSLVFQTLDKSSNIDTSTLSRDTRRQAEAKEDDLEPYHFHIYSHKHNTHITCTKPNREPIISLSAGNIGFRKSRRGLFDSAYSLTKYVLERLIHNGWPMKMNRLEIVLRGFGQGREAALKVLMSPEGKVLRDKIVRVADSTRIKFGGTRSEKPRRL
ncbi:ribosomal 18 mitochondrial [Fusarium sp. NRRL 52700]|nr:ribosomal 18 mitochondrial [Fusarium sp. NRRL 52700]